MQRNMPRSMTPKQYQGFVNHLRIRDEQKKYILDLTAEINPLLQEVLDRRPKDSVAFMIEWLRQRVKEKNPLPGIRADSVTDMLSTIVRQESLRSGPPPSAESVRSLRSGLPSSMPSQPGLRSPRPSAESVRSGLPSPKPSQSIAPRELSQEPLQPEVPLAKPSKPAEEEEEPISPFKCASAKAGWQVVCAGEAGVDLPEEEESQRKGCVDIMREILYRGGVTVVRVGVSEDMQKLSGTSRAMFQTLIPPGTKTMRELSDEWFADAKELFALAKVACKEAVEDDSEENIQKRDQLQGAAEHAFETKAEERMLRQIDRTDDVLTSLKKDIPEDFGAVYVMMALERERDTGNYEDPPYFQLICFKWIVDDEALGAGGRSVNNNTRSLGKVLPRLMSRIEVDNNTDYNHECEAQETFKNLYSKTFGGPSRQLGKEKLKAADDAIQNLNRFIQDVKRASQCQQSVAGVAVETVQETLDDYRESLSDPSRSSILTSAQAFHLTRYLDSHGGDQTHLAKKEVLRKEREAREAEEQRRIEFIQNQEGPERVRDTGSFSVEEGEYDPRLPFFVEYVLNRGKWVCFRIPEEKDIFYEVVDTGRTAPATTYSDDFHQWQAKLPTEGGKPLSYGNYTSIPINSVKAAKVEINKTSRERFADAANALQHIEEAQSLCVYRIAAPVDTEEDVCAKEPKYVDLCTTWAGTVDEHDVKTRIANNAICFKDRANKVRCWLMSHHVLCSDFLRNAFADDFGTDYDTAIKKGRGQGPRKMSSFIEEEDLEA